MSDYTMAQAKRDYDRGMILEAKIIPPHDLIENGWHVYLDAGQWGDGCLVDARSRAVRFFKTADSAIKAIQQIGFKVAVLRVGQF